MKVTGVIQAGGRSTRMGGQPKGLIELGADARVAFMNVNMPAELEHARALARELD